MHGVGYEVDADEHLLQPAGNGRKVSLLTHFVVREDAQILFGFGSEAERFAFRQLVKISGSVGAHRAVHFVRPVGDRSGQAVAMQGSRSADQGARHRQEDRPNACCSNGRREAGFRCRGAASAGADIWRQPATISSTHCWRSATKKHSGHEALPRIGTADGIRQALKRYRKA